TDGRKMSKSYGNAISLGEEEKSLQKKISSMLTDPARLRRSDPGNPDQCNLFPLHELFSPSETQAQVRQGCTSAGIGCVDCKKMLLPYISDFIAPIREKRTNLLSQPKKLDEILHEGSQKAREVAKQNLAQVKDAIHCGVSRD
ncbi:MAG: hypothetical protein KDD52_08635, partial [Bdellovibrionales bacterium]|nr:hypothetical protein [Bdellovibrionales bacterium]